jgi:hypothetical protein
VIIGTGTITGVIGGSANQNELEAIFITSNDTSAGLPPNQDSSVANTITGCSMTFGSPNGIMTDITANQQYPVCTLEFRIVGEETVTGSVVFNDTQFAVIGVNDVPGSFSFDLESGDVSYNG